MAHGRGQGGPDGSPSLAISMMQARPEALADEALGPERAAGDMEADGEEYDLSGLPPKWRQVATAIREAAEEHGAFSKGESGYEPRSMRGQKCQGCFFYEGGPQDGPCSVVEGAVKAEGVCNFFVGKDSSYG